MKLPKTIGSYRLLGSLPKYATPEKLLIGRYEKNGKSYAVKIWYEGMLDTYQKELLHEFSAATMLHNVLNIQNKGKGARIQTPKPIEIFRTPAFTALITEFSPGRQLSLCHPQVRARVLAQTIQQFEKISLQCPEILPPMLRRHPWWLYAASLPYVALRACMKRKIPVRHILASTWTCILHIGSLASRPAVLAHRDLLPENILVHGRNVIVLDCAHLVLTPKGYDLTYLCIHEILHGLSKKILRLLKAKPDPFFTAYICLLNSHNYNPIQNTNYYAATLSATYE